MQRVLPLAFTFAFGCAIDPVDAGATLDSSSGSATAAQDSGGSSGAADGATSTADDSTADDSTPDEGADTSSTGTATEGIADSANDSAGELCMRWPEQFDCDDPVDCVEFAECGGFSRFDDDGCGRPPCSAQSGCPDGMTCIRPQQDWGECQGSGACDDAEDGTCSCFIQLDCGAEYCMPIEEAPPTACFAITDMAECAAAGCDVITAIGSSFEPDTCACEPLEVCVWLGDSEPVDEPATYYVGNEGPYILVEQRYEPRPFGLLECDGPGCPCIGGCGT